MGLLNDVYFRAKDLLLGNSKKLENMENVTGVGGSFPLTTLDLLRHITFSLFDCLNRLLYILLVQSITVEKSDSISFYLCQKKFLFL